MWILFAFGSAFFAGITAILAKCGIRKTDSTVATAVRTIVVLLFSWLGPVVYNVWGETQQDNSYKTNYRTDTVTVVGEESVAPSSAKLTYSPPAASIIWQK